MTLGIITDCTHYKTPGGKICTENHILLRQFESLSAYFTHTIIVCPFGQFDEHKVVSYYNKPAEFVPVPLVGGDTLVDKLKLVSAMPKWLEAFRYLDEHSDMVYQRFPNNLNIPGYYFFKNRKKKVFATYTGTWSNYKGEPFTYRWQRRFLQKGFRGPVWVYDQQSNGRIKAGFSPSYNLADWEEETEQVTKRIHRLQNQPVKVYRFITVGTLINYKNQLAIVKACKQLKDLGFPFHLTIVGDGPLRIEIEDYVDDHQLHDCITIAGKKDQQALRELYRSHDFIIQSPLKEGFGKVPIEGFFHGTVPIINNISMAASLLGNGERGFLFDASKQDDLLQLLLSLPGKQHLLPGMIERGRQYARTQTLEAWAKEYYETVMDYYSEA